MTKQCDRVILQYAPAYHPRYEAYCIKSCYTNVLHSYEVFNPTAYMYAALDWQLQINNNEAKFVTNLQPLPYSLRHKETIINIPSGDNGLYDVLQIVNDGVPCIVNVDGYFLSYHPLFKTEHENHAAVLYGYNMNLHTIYISDYMPPYFFNGEISISEFLEARINPCAILDRHNWPNQLETIILETLFTTMSTFFNHFQNNRGATALGRFIDYSLSTDNSDVSLTKIHIQLGKLDGSIRFFYYYLTQVANQMTGLNEIIVFLKQWLHDWHLLKISLLKTIYSPKKSDEYKRWIISILDGVSKFEKTLTKAIQFFAKTSQGDWYKI